MFSNLGYNRIALVLRLLASALLPDSRLHAEPPTETSHVALVACLVHDTRCKALDKLPRAAQSDGQLADDGAKVDRMTPFLHQAQHGGHGQLLPA